MPSLSPRVRQWPRRRRSREPCPRSSRQWNSCARHRETREIDESMRCPRIPRKFRVLTSFGRPKSEVDASAWPADNAPWTRRVAFALLLMRGHSRRAVREPRSPDVIPPSERRKREESADSRSWMKNRWWHWRSEIPLFHAPPLWSWDTTTTKTRSAASLLLWFPRETWQRWRWFLVARGRRRWRGKRGCYRGCSCDSCLFYVAETLFAWASFLARRWYLFDRDGAGLKNTG